jgi:hypothetical protein
MGEWKNLVAPLCDDQIILVTIWHTHTIGWQPKFFGPQEGK